MRRVYEVDVLECDKCGGRRRVISMIMDPEVVVAILESLELPTDRPAISPSRLPVQGDFEFIA